MIRFLNIPTSMVALFLSELVLLLTCYLIATALLMPVDPGIFLLYDQGLERIGIVVASVLLAYYFQDLYAVGTVRSTTALLQQVCLAFGAAFIGQALVGYLSLSLMLPRVVMLAGTVAAYPAMVAWRTLFSALLAKTDTKETLLFVGANTLVLELTRAYKESPEIGFRCVGYVDDDPGAENHPNLPLLGTTAELKAVVAQTRPNRIITSIGERRSRLPIYELLELHYSGIPIEQIISLYEETFGRIAVRELRPSDLIFASGFGPNPNNVRIQTLLSFLIAVVLAAITAPIMLLVAIGIKLTSPGPIFYRQTRVGKDDKPFTILKFRSMREDAETETGAVWAVKEDPRITGIGKWLRKLRLDELPQVFNVLKGEMSIVGPRPERPEFTQELEQKIPFYRHRTSVKPGITGWAQINYKYGDTLDDTIIKLEYDLYYIKHMSLILDLYIMLSTSKIVFLGRGGQ